MTPGDVYWVDLPRANGHEQSGRRPAVVLQDDTFANASPMVVAVPMTTAMAAQRFPATVVLQPTAENGLGKPSVVLVFQLRATDRRRFIERIGSVGPEALAAIYAALDQLTGRANPSPPAEG
jgi:mRNA interferase MazF